MRNEELTGLLIFREATPADVSFLYSSFLRSYRESPIVKGVDNSTYYNEQAKVVAKLLQNCEVKVVSPTNDLNSILGYIIYKNDTIHFVYVKHAFRKLGIGRLLVETYCPEFVQYTHFCHRKPTTGIYNPFAI